MRPLIVLLAAALMSAPGWVAGQEVRECDTFEANARNLSFHSDRSPAVQLFANGEVWTIGLDTIEPACCSSHLMVNYFTDLEPFPYCALISASEGLGFSGIGFEQMTASYDPAVGLILTMPAGRYDGAVSILSPLVVTINRATATVTAHHE